VIIYDKIFESEKRITSQKKLLFSTLNSLVYFRESISESAKNYSSWFCNVWHSFTDSDWRMWELCQMRPKSQWCPHFLYIKRKWNGFSVAYEYISFTANRGRFDWVSSLFHACNGYKDAWHGVGTTATTLSIVHGINKHQEWDQHAAPSMT
jgi:hypothetical protein